MFISSFQTRRDHLGKTEAVFGSLETFAQDLGDEPDVASLQARAFEMGVDTFHLDLINNP